MRSSSVHFSQRSLRTADQPISYFMKQAVENPDLISLAAGLVDSVSVPAAEVLEVAAEILGQPCAAQAALQYGTTQGLRPLRDKLLARTCFLDGVEPPDLSLTADNVVVTTGSQQLLYLVGEMLFDPGDIVIAEAPSYFVYQGTLSSLGVRTLSVPVDDEGLNTDSLAELLAKLERTSELPRLRLIYVCDYFQNPTGLTLSLARRRRLLDLVRRYSRHRRVFILEDAAYRELRYEGEDLPSIKSFDDGNQHVILTMTFSKACAPGLKTGYAVLPKDLVEPLLRLKGNHDFGSNNFTQHLIDRLLETGKYDRQVAKLRDVYREKRDAILEALAQEFPPASGVRWVAPRGGLYVWLSFPRHIACGPDGQLMHEALGEGVLYVPGEFCYVKNDNESVPTWEARLCFGVATLEQIREAVRRLGRAVREVVSEGVAIGATSTSAFH